MLPYQQYANPGEFPVRNLSESPIAHAAVNHPNRLTNDYERFNAGVNVNPRRLWVGANIYSPQFTALVPAIPARVPGPNG